MQEIISQGANGRDLRDADLSNADLSNAILSGAILSGANVNRTLFGNNQGIEKSLKQDLIQRGAIFTDSPGDRSEVLVPR